jgi:hypothetical protein
MLTLVLPIFRSPFPNPAGHILTLPGPFAEILTTLPSGKAAAAALFSTEMPSAGSQATSFGSKTIVVIKIPLLRYNIHYIAIIAGINDILAFFRQKPSMP